MLLLRGYYAIQTVLYMKGFALFTNSIPDLAIIVKKKTQLMELYNCGTA